MTTLRDRLEHWHAVTSETNTPPEPLFDIAEDAVERIRELEAKKEALGMRWLKVADALHQDCHRLNDRIRELEDERDIFARTLDKRDAENKRLREAQVEAENKRLREAIEGAPHDGGCPLDGLRAESRWNPNSDEPCTCWKSKALENTDGR